jgi:hypothetical protein
LVVAAAVFFAVAGVASAGYTYTDTYCGHLHSSGYICADDHGHHTYGENFADYNGTGVSYPLCRALLLPE